jgi:integrase
VRDMARRAHGEDAVYFEHAKETVCREERYHRRCTGRWRGEISLGNEAGRRQRRRVSGESKASVLDQLKNIRADMDSTIQPDQNWTVQRAVDEWLAHGLEGRAAGTLQTNQHVIAPLTELVGDIPLTELTATDLRKAMKKLAATRSTRTMQVMHNAVERAIRHSEADDRVARNVASLIRPPEGKAPGRPSKSLTLEQAQVVLKAASESWLAAYVSLSLFTGIRTEEARAVRDDHLFLDDQPPYVAVWRSVRLSGDTKTPASRRTLELPVPVVDVLRLRMVARDAARQTAAELWVEHGLVFCNSRGRPLSAAVVRDELKDITERAKIGRDWTPRELRHSFVSLMSESGVPVDEIARLVGHTSSRTTEVIYRHELRPVMQFGATAMTDILAPKPKRRVVRRPSHE